MITLNLHLTDPNGETRLIKKFFSGNGEYLIGSKAADILLNYPTVSKQHSKLTIQDDKVSVIDLGSRNGSTIVTHNGTPIKLQKQIPQDFLKEMQLLIGPYILTWNLHNADQNQLQASSQTKKQKLLEHFAAQYSKALSQNPEHAKNVLTQELEKHLEFKAEFSEKIFCEFHQNGPLEELLQNSACKEILINSFDSIYIDIGQGLEQYKKNFISDTSYQAWVFRTIQLTGRRLDLQHPICEATLPNGSRFHAVLSPIAVNNISVAIRKFGSAPISETQAIASKWLSPAALDILKKAIQAKINIVISGGTSSGKTSLLNFLCQYLPAVERIITIEDTVELSPPVKNLVQLQARKPNADGVGEISLRELIQSALRMRPDRIIVGECRGAEVLEMLQALNTGHPGSITTVHANSSQEALDRLELLALFGAPNLTPQCVQKWVQSSIEMVIQVERSTSGERLVSQIILKANHPFYHTLGIHSVELKSETSPYAVIYSHSQMG